MPALTPEHELMLLCSQVSIDSGVVGRIQALVNSSIDWDALLLAASRNHVLGLVAHSLVSHNLVAQLSGPTCERAIPATTLEFLRDCSRKTAARNHYLAAELKRVSALFRANGVPALAYGGPLLTPLAYGDASLRETNNIEFVLPPEKILVARNLLIAEGYRREYTWDSAREAAELRFRRVLALDRAEDGIHIWLFGDLDPGNYSRPRTFASLAQSTVTLDGESVATLSREDALLQACVRAGSEALSPQLCLIGDTARLGANLDDDAWRRVLSTAGSLGLKRKVLVTLTLASRLLGAKHPQVIESSLQSDRIVPELCSHVIRSLFSDKDYVSAMRERVAVQLAARDRVVDKARFLIRFAAVPTREDWAMMSLPAPLYYALRPFRMLGRRVGLFRQQHLAVFMPTPNEIVEEMLALAEVGPADTVYDLGCGDGRIVIGAAQRHGARGVGVDLDPDRVAEAKARASAAGVDHLVTFSQQNVMDVDLSSASVVSLFLSPQANLMLRPRLNQQLPPQARIVSRSHDMGDWAPLKTKLVACDGALSRIYLWRLDGKAKPQKEAL